VSENPAASTELTELIIAREWLAAMFECAWWHAAPRSAGVRNRPSSGEVLGRGQHRSALLRPARSA
jgi:hypothetical protein